MAEISTSITIKITTLYAMTYDELKAAIIAVIKTNYNQEITAVVLQDILTEIMQTMEVEDQNVLAESKKYTNAREDSIRKDFAAADQSVLSQAKEYADTVKDWNDESNRKKIWTGTQEEYDALPTKDPNTIYLTDDNRMTVTPTSLVFPAGGGSQTLSIVCDPSDQWTVAASLPEGWSATPLSGTGRGAVTIQAIANGTSELLTGSITVTGGGLTMEIPYTQPAIPSKETIDLTIDGLNFSSGVVRITTITGSPIYDTLSIKGQAGGGSTPVTPWTIQMLPGNTDGQTSIGSSIDSAEILSVNDDNTSPYEGVNANYTWNNTRKTK